MFLVCTGVCKAGQDTSKSVCARGPSAWILGLHIFCTAYIHTRLRLTSATLETVQTLPSYYLHLPENWQQDFRACALPSVPNMSALLWTLYDLSLQPSDLCDMPVLCAARYHCRLPQSRPLALPRSGLTTLQYHHSSSRQSTRTSFRKAIQPGVNSKSRQGRRLQGCGQQASPLRTTPALKSANAEYPSPKPATMATK